MREDTIKIKCETEGFDEAIEQVEALVEAYDGLPPQVQIKNCHDCTIKIYPSQTKIIEVKDDNAQTDCDNCMYLHCNYECGEDEPQTERNSDEDR